jgi:putative endonuclease
MTMDCFVYLMATGYRGTLYVGVTSNLIQRAHQHREHVFSGFTAKYGVSSLVWFEGTPSIEAAIRREKQIKGWKREWKIELVETVNPKWRDLYPQLLGASARDPGSSPG